MFMGQTLVTFRNPERRDTFGQQGVKPVKITMFDAENGRREFVQPVLKGSVAEQVRDRQVDRILVEFA